ncbi:MAG: glucose-fructose oxidoreductase, partial [Armatimonadetes bacterium CG_4_10_14_3_um_filter_66_18]
FLNAIADVVACLDSGNAPVLSARKALQATEVIFATYESARRGARVDLPLEVEVDPFTHMREPVA